MINIFVDMDGVLCNFKSAYKTMFNEEKDDFNRTLFERFVLNNGFETLEAEPNAHRLISLLNDIKDVHQSSVNIEILSSAGNSIYLNKVVQQKNNWLKKSGIDWTPNFVQHKGLKKRFASPKSILIDDTSQNIFDFEEMYGQGVYYKDYKFDESIRVLVDKFYKIIELEERKLHHV